MSTLLGATVNAPPVIETARLRLRAADARDERAVEHMFTDPDVMRHYARVARPGAGANWLKAVRRYAARDGLAPWTVELHDETFVGQCGPLLQDIGNERAFEIICFFERPFWRAGYADEAVRAAIAAVFERTGVPRIVALIYPDNRPSVRLALRTGLHFERFVTKDGDTMALYVLERTAAVSAAASGDS